MGKSGQREYPIADAFLNITREVVLLILSSVFWVYCYSSILVMLGSLFESNAEIVLLLRSVLNMHLKEMDVFFDFMIISLMITFIFFTLSFIFVNRSERRKFI